MSTGDNTRTKKEDKMMVTVVATIIIATATVATVAVLCSPTKYAKELKEER